MSKHIRNYPNSLQPGPNLTSIPMRISSTRKSLFILLTLFAVLLTAGAIIPTALAAEKKLIAIIVPSPENPFFKALADAA